MANGIKAVFRGVLAELARLADGIDQAAVDGLVDLLSGDRRIYAAGAGRSGLLLRCFVMRLMHMGREVYAVGDVVTPAARKGDVLLIGSGSGETGSLAGLAAKAGKMGMTVALVTANPDSTIGRMAEHTVRLPAPTPKAAGTGTAVSFQPMGNLFEQGMFLLLDCVVMEMMRREGIGSEDMFRRHANLE